MRGGRFPIFVFLLFLSPVLLSGCSWLEEWPPAERQLTKRPPEPQPRVMQTSDATWLQPDSTVLPVDHSGPTSDMAAMQRLESLEKQVAEMRNDMNMMMPALTRLVEVQMDLQAVLKHYQPAPGMPGDGAYPQDISPQAAYSAVQGAQPLQQQAQAAVPVMTPGASSGAGPTVRQLRFGEHGDKTRLVLDTSVEIPFRYDLDNGKSLLMVSLPGVVWTAPREGNFSRSPLVASYNAMPDGQGGTRLAVQLKKPAEILWAQSIPPNDGKSNRVVIDIAPR